MEETNLKKCRNCSYDLKKGIGRCPYCGTVNPTVDTKDIFKVMFIIIFVMFIYSYFQ